MHKIFTLGVAAGYENKLTLPKSSPVARTFLLLDLPTVLTSVPSLPSGQIPV